MGLILRNLISWFESEDFNLWVWVSEFGLMGLGFRNWISSFGSDDLDLWG